MYLFFDTETTGKRRFDLSYGHPDQPSIVQLAAQVTCDLKIVRAEMNVLIRPNGWTIPEEATAVHGITTEDCEKYGIPIEFAIAMFDNMAFAANLPSESGFMVAHNMNFDMGMIRTEMLRMGCVVTPSGSMPYATHNGFRKFCTMLKSINVCRIPHPTKNGYKWPKLKEAVSVLCEREQTKAHDAMGDVVDCRDVFFSLKRRWEAAIGQDLPT